MTAETSNARGEWVLVPREPTQAMREAFNDWRPTEGNNYAGAQSFNAQERWAFRQRYAALLAAAPPPPPPAAARGDVPYDRELIARMLDAAESPAFTMEEMDTQARLLREAAQAKPEAQGVVDDGSRIVTSQLLHWGGIPVRVTGTVTTSPGNWPLIDAALTGERNG